MSLPVTPRPALNFSTGAIGERVSSRRVYPGELMFAMFWPTTSSPVRWASRARDADVRLAKRSDMASHAGVETTAGHGRGRLARRVVLGRSAMRIEGGAHEVAEADAQP